MRGTCAGLGFRMNPKGSRGLAHGSLPGLAGKLPTGNAEVESMAGL